ncbi:MAG: 50S ribosomal protein L24 [Actinobacteria bacterium]|nr:50S ribosomal protein L24 [Actinomycetota bacterium]
MQIKKDDMVRVMAGKDRGKEGRVLRVLPRDGRIMVDGVAMAKKHTRSGARGRGGQQLQQGGIVDVEMMIDASNVQILCGACGQPTRVGHRMDGDQKVRICAKCETEL